MTVQPNITVNFPAPFPVRVQGDGAVTVTKVNGVWHVGLNYPAQLDVIPLPSQFTTDTILYYNAISQTYLRISLTELFGLTGGIPSPTIVTAAGTYTVISGDTVILINKTVSAANSVQLPTIASRFGVPLVVKDFKGDAAGNNITILPSGAETIEGGASKILNTNFQRIKLVPLAGQTKWYVD